MSLQAAQHSRFSSRSSAATSLDKNSMERRSYSSEFVVKKRDNYFDDNNESQNKLDRASQHIALDVEKKEQEYLKIRLEHSSALQTLSAEIQQLVIPSPRINREQSVPVSASSAPLATTDHSSHSSLKSVQASSAAAVEKLSIPAGYEGAVTSEWIQKMVMDSLVQTQQQQILQLQQQVQSLTEHTTKQQYQSSSMDSHQLFERYGASLASLQAQLASMETKQIAYENITNKKLFDLASRIEALEESHRSGVSEGKKKSSVGRAAVPESTSATLIEDLTRRLELLESFSPTFSDSKRSFYGHLNSSSQGDSPAALVAAAAARPGYSAQFAEAASNDSRDSDGSSRSGQRRRSGRERNRSRKIKVEAPRLDFENLAIQLTSTERRHYPWLSNDDSV